MITALDFALEKMYPGHMRQDDLTASLKAFDASKEAHYASARAKEGRTETGMKMSPRAQQMAHAQAGIEHLKAADAHRASGGDEAERHTRLAEHEAAQAGGAWDESKHPRDNDGKFT